MNIHEYVSAFVARFRLLNLNSVPRGIEFIANAYTGEIYAIRMEWGSWELTASGVSLISQGFLPALLSDLDNRRVIKFRLS